MHKRNRYLLSFRIALFFSLAAATACVPQRGPVEEPSTSSATSTLVPTQESSTAIAADLAVAETTAQVLDWPIYNLASELPYAPAQLSLYTHAVPAGLPGEGRLAAIMTQLQLTGTASTYSSEAGDTEISVTGDSGNFRLMSDDPFILAVENAPPESDTSATVLSPDLRAQNAEEFLSDRGLLDFPYLIEPSRMSRDRDRAVRIVPLIDGYPLYDYDPLNGRLLVLFNSAGEISSVFWRPLKLIADNPVSIIPANVAWEQFVKGDLPTGGAVGQCWQATVFDPNEPNGIATPLNSPPCINSFGGPNRSYKAATIHGVELVYFANDLRLGMSPFAYAADSPARVVFPMWQFPGLQMMSVMSRSSGQPSRRPRIFSTNTLRNQTVLL